MRRCFLFYLILFFSILVLPLVISDIPTSGPCPEACMYFDDEIGLERCMCIDGYSVDEYYVLQNQDLYYFVHNNKSYDIFDSHYEMYNFNKYLNNVYYNAKIVRFYEDGRKKGIYTDINFDFLNIPIIEGDKWDFQILENTKGLLTKDDLNIEFDLSDKNLIKSSYFKYYDMDTNKQSPITMDLLDIFLDKRRDSYDAIFLLRNLESSYSNDFFIYHANSINNDHLSNSYRKFVLNMIDNNNVEFILNENKFHFDYKYPSIYINESGGSRLLISLNDYYLGGDKSENYVDIIFIQYKIPSLNGIYKVIKYYDDKLHIKMYSPEELSYLYNLNDPSIYAFNYCDEDQCSVDNKCYKVGDRKDYKYCSDERYNFVSQKSEGKFCNNNFECGSNLCLNGKCFGPNSDQSLEIILDENVSRYFPDEDNCKYMYSNYSIGLINECLNYNAFRGPEIWGLQYYIDNNNQVTVFKKGIIEALSFAGMNYGPSFSAKIVRYYEDGRREIVSERNDRPIDDIFSIDDWAVLMNVRDKKAALKNSNLDITSIDFLSKNNKIETQIIEGELYSEPVRAKLSLLDLYYCKNEKKYISITAGVEDMELGEVYIDPIDSSQKDEIITLSRDGVLSVELDKNKKFSFNKKVPYIYEDKSEDDRFVIGLVDFYIEGDETENYVELSFIKTSYEKLDGIFEFVYLRKLDGYDTYDKKSFTAEELSYMGHYDLRNPFECGINSQCLFDGKCYPLGYRKDNRYCSEERFNFRFQKESEEFCENNFECVSNVCLENECVSVNFLQRVVNWFKKLFNAEQTKE